MSETQQHIGWLKQYLGGMTAENWKDMRDLAIRQVDDLARTPAPDAVREALEQSVLKLEKIGAWLERLAIASDAQARDTRFVTLAEAAAADAKNYRKTVADLIPTIAKARAALSKPAGEE